MRSSCLPLAMLALLAVVHVGCGGDNAQNFSDCGNGRIDDGEGCDDGNLDDHDACNSACQPASCGDGVVHTGTEECDGRDLANQTCEPMGLTGSPACDSSCRFDFSACGPPPTATLPATATATPAPSTPTPTATPGSQCGDGLLSQDESCDSCSADCTPHPCEAVSGDAKVDVNLHLPSADQVNSITVMLAYRTSIIGLPSTMLQARFTPAQMVVVRPTDQGYAVDTRVARTQGGVPTGLIFTVSFDRCAGAAAPTGSDFACTVTQCGALSGCTCTVDVRP